MKKDILKTNPYFKLLHKILKEGHIQRAKKGDSKALLNEVVRLSPSEVDDMLEVHKVAKTKLACELDLYLKGTTNLKAYQKKCGIHWWDYAKNLKNTYPTFMKELPPLLEKMKKRGYKGSKNYVLGLIGDFKTNSKSPQIPCLSAMQFQFKNGKGGQQHLHITVFQRSADSNLGLPSDIYQTALIAKQIDLPLGSITFFIGNAHIYSNNIKATEQELNEKQNKKIKYKLNV